MAGASASTGEGGGDSLVAEGGAGGAPFVEEDPVFVLGTRVWDDTTTTSYFHVVPSLEADTEVDATQALEAPGAAKLYSIPGAGWFAVGGGEAPTITRYTLSDENQLVPGEEISLANYGVESLWDTLYVVSPTKMYYPDRDGQRLIIINPSAMAIEGEGDLAAETGREGFLSVYSYAHLTRGENVLFSVAWIDWNESDSILGETGLVVVNTQTDEVERVDIDDRCGGITQPVTASNGDVYFPSSALAATAHRLGRLPTAPCALRVAVDAGAFDAEHATLLADLTGRDIVGEPVPGGGDEVFLRVFDEDAGTVSDTALTWELTSQPVWHWLRWNVVTDDVTPVEELNPSTSDVMWFQVDGRVYGTQTAPEYVSTTLIELTAEGGPVERLTAPGFLHGVARIR
jgi:hypothetical protein